MSQVTPEKDDDQLEAGWESARRRKFTIGLAATPAERLAWLETMIALAWASGALPRPRTDAWAQDGHGASAPAAAR